MKVARVLDELTEDAPCLGALFTSYTFNPELFENHVLRAVLRLTSDPIEQTDRYQQEARLAIQKTPIVAIVDASERSPGRRLPYDFLEVSNVVFHPKSALLLYDDHARLLIGSGNITEGGFSQNNELFICQTLRYDVPNEAALLIAFDGHLDRITQLVRRTGTQLDQFRETLQRRLPEGSTDGSILDLALIDSTQGAIMDQVAALLPDSSSIDSIGMLAPFYERDDLGVETDSVFSALESRLAKQVTLDIGLAWDNKVSSQKFAQLEDGIDRIWTQVRSEDIEHPLEHLMLKSIGPNTISYIDDDGNNRRWNLRKARTEVAEGKLWLQPQPAVFAPKDALSRAASRFSKLRIWLHPDTQLVNGRPLHRQLHAKLLTIGYSAGCFKGTLVIVGSPNMSRRALLMPVGPGQGNVEIALAFSIDSSVTLRNFLPTLVCVPLEAITLSERTFPDPGVNYALAIENALHDPAERLLTIAWSKNATDLPPWRLVYEGRELAAAETAPTAPLICKEFVLSASSCEVILEVNGKPFSIPILVTDLCALPVTSVGVSLGLEELLMLLGHRIGGERAVQIAEHRAAQPDDEDSLSAFFAEGFSPTDVFRAWWAIAEDLSDPQLSAQAFRFKLRGALGLGAVWLCMREAMNNQRLTAVETWFYGAELLRTLCKVEISPGNDTAPKKRELTTFMEQIQKDLELLAPDTDTQHWTQPILEFYGEASR